MTITAVLSDEVVAKVEALAEQLDMCFEDTFIRVVGLGISLYQDHEKGAKVLIKRPYRGIREVIL